MPSTVVEFANYDPEQKVLLVKFRNGRLYRYLDVPQTEYNAFRASGSMGRYLNSVIKLKYKFTKAD